MLAYRLAHARHFFMDILGMKRATAKIIHNLLNLEKNSFIHAQEILSVFNDDLDLLIEILIGGKSWLYCYDIKPKPKLSIFLGLKR